VRLNFLEFFGNFYEAGGKEYKPFQKTGGENKV
jgi:vacuolar-type H+-ATPase subunit I/STV1